MTDIVAPQTTENGALPEGWAMTTLGEICARVEKANPKDDPQVAFTYLDIAAIDNSTQRITETKTYAGADAPSRARQVVRSGDVLFSTVRTYLKNIAQVPRAYDGQIASTGFTVIRPMLGVEHRFLFQLVQTNAFLEPLNAKQRGTSYPAVRDTDVFAQPVALPPLNEQRRIVEKIEELFTKLDAGVRSLEQARAQLKSYRRSVLKAAVEGELSREWRESHRGELESASQLLERITEERLRNSAAGGERNKGTLKNTDLPELPQDWLWARFGQVAVVAADLTDPTAMPGAYHIAPNHIEKGTGRLLSISTVSDDAVTSPKHRFRPGQILYSKIRPYLAKAALVDFEGVCSADMYPISALIHNGFLHKWLLSDWFTHAASHHQGRTVLPKINRKALDLLPVPVPPIDEQEYIAAEVERRLSVVEKLEATVEVNLKQAGGLRQSILKRAFSGELVPQDPDDEPAGVLLERIREERQATMQKIGKKSVKAKRQDPAGGQALELFPE